MSKGLFITGTGTDVGKTYVSALILKALKESGTSSAYYKAAMSGNTRAEDGSLIPGDALYVRQISGISQPLNEMCPYVYEHAVSPHLASRMEGNPVQLSRVTEQFHTLCSHYDYITMEGSGGILCPICYDETKLMMPDVIRACSLPCLIVADAGLGTINHVGLTAAFLKTQKIPLKGIILNHFHPGDLMQEDNLRMCEWICQAPVVACVQDGDHSLNISSDLLKSLYETV